MPYRFLEAAAVGILIVVICIAVMGVRLIGQMTQAMTERTRVLLGFVVAPAAGSVCCHVIRGLRNVGWLLQDFGDAVRSGVWFIPEDAGWLLGFYIWTMAFGVPAYFVLRFLGKRGAESYGLTGTLIAAGLVMVVLPIEYSQDALSPPFVSFWTSVARPAVIAAPCGLAAAEAFWWIAVRPANEDA